MSLVGFRYIQSSQPAEGYAGYQWFNTTTGVVKEWTGTNVYPSLSPAGGQWIQIYDANQSNGGLLPITGGSVTGSITGTTGWASSDNYNFPTSLKVSGQNVATVSYVNQQVTSFNDLISAKISQAIAATTASVSANQNIGKFGQGTAGNGYFEPTSANKSDTVPDVFAAIPLPRYQDGSLASETECVWIGAPAGMITTGGNDAGLFTGDANNDGENFFVVQTFEQSNPRVFQHYWAPYYTSGGVRSFKAISAGGGYIAGGMYWMIIAVKVNA